MTIIDEATGINYSIGPEWSVLRPPKYSYHLHITPSFIINIVEGREPNWFHRWMQKICFGFRWEKID